ncbi:hypothetical protein ZWY2020_046823 [Hordeum vulgare]|nr:hypothetical protein ZWY2020_046823 [Hordeum vulgare]
MYIRVKRNKTTYFIQCYPTQTIFNIKQKLQSITDHPPNNQRLILLATNNILDDSKTLDDQKLVALILANESVILFVNFCGPSSFVSIAEPSKVAEASSHAR